MWTTAAQASHPPVNMRNINIFAGIFVFFLFLGFILCVCTSPVFGYRVAFTLADFAVDEMFLFFLFLPTTVEVPWNFEQKACRITVSLNKRCALRSLAFGSEIFRSSAVTPIRLDTPSLRTGYVDFVPCCCSSHLGLFFARFVCTRWPGSLSSLRVNGFVLPARRGLLFWLLLVLVLSWRSDVSPRPCLKRSPYARLWLLVLGSGAAQVEEGRTWYNSRGLSLALQMLYIRLYMW